MSLTQPWGSLAIADDRLELEIVVDAVLGVLAPVSGLFVASQRRAEVPDRIRPTASLTGMGGGSWLASLGAPSFARSPLCSTLTWPTTQTRRAIPARFKVGRLCRRRTGSERCGSGLLDLWLALPIKRLDPKSGRLAQR
jgi:hypothetical protein